MKGMGGNGLVKGGIEHRHLRYGREQLHRHLNAIQIGGVMQWCQGNIVLDRLDHQIQ